MFTGVGAVRYAEAKIKIKSLEQSVVKKVSLNHSKIVYRFTANIELYTVNVNSSLIIDTSHFDSYYLRSTNSFQL